MEQSKDGDVIVVRSAAMAELGARALARMALDKHITFEVEEEDE